MIIRIPFVACLGRLRFLLGLALFVFAASQINAAYFWPVLIAWLWHECGHLAVARLFSIRLRPQSGLLGVGLTAEREPQPAAAALIAVAGPLADILWLGLTALLGWTAYAQAALVLAVINLLPILPLDGGRALIACSRRYFPAERLRGALCYGGQVFAFLLVLLILAFRLRLWLLLLPPVIYLLATAEGGQADYASARRVFDLWRQQAG